MGLRSSILRAGLPCLLACLAAAAAPAGARAQDAQRLQRARDLTAEAQQRVREGRYREAIPRAREALAIREQALGPIHPEVAQSLHGLAVPLQETGDLAAERSLYERALHIREQALGPGHPDVAASLNGLAFLNRTVGDHAAARALYRRALPIVRSATIPELSWRVTAGLAATYENVVFFPNDLLLYLPIHALTRKAADGTVRFLAETHAVSYVTQLELVDLLSPAPAGSSASVLAVANPDGSLPAASREVRELARIRGPVTTLEGQEATKSGFLGLVSRFPDLHLATHGVLNPERPELSYLLLAGDDEASQRLTIGDIAGLSLAPNALAILSGCETALGEQVPGAVLVTLAAAFSQAGSQSIVASLWKVSNTATRDFMVALHRALPKAGRVGALQQAQLAVLRNPATAHPYYWAPFILIGAR